MKKIYISRDANRLLTEYLEGLGYTPEFISSERLVDPAISNHPDVFLCKMGVLDDSPIFFAEADDLGMDYPLDCAFNAACTGKYFIHNLACTNEKLLMAAKTMDMKLIDVKQGYTKCSIAVIDEDSIITYDDGIFEACKAFPKLNVLKIAPGFVKLDGYDTGFIGGACGRVGSEVIFNGDLFPHPDFSRIVSFIESRGLTCRWFADYKLTDIGSIL